MKPSALCYLAAVAVLGAAGLPAQTKQIQNSEGNLARDKLVAWCIVPFDGKKRGPAARAEMLKRLGIKRVAYDWRKEHVPTFEEEIRQYKKHGLEYFAFWGIHETAFRLFEKYDLHPQIWQIIPQPQGKTSEQRVASAARQLLPLVERTRKLGCKLGLYNHGGWSGEPANMIAVCRYLREKHRAGHVGIVYNLHHGHEHIADFANLLRQMQPHLLCLNLNGMTKNGDKVGRKILPLGEGEHDVVLLKTIRKSGYKGPIGIIGHTQDDVEERLRDNLDGLDWILPQLRGKPAGSRPKLRTYSPRKPATSATGARGYLLKGRAEFRRPPITIECRVTLNRRNQYNILVASDTKRSGAHWEIFSMNGSGLLTAYLPGYAPDHVYSKAMICDGKPHHLAMVYEPTRVQLFVDGKRVAEQAVKSRNRPVVPAGLAVNRLVEGGIGSSSEVQWLHIQRGAKAISRAKEAPNSSADTLLLFTKREPTKTSVVPLKYSPQLVRRQVTDAEKFGDARRGLLAFSSAKSACLSCHKLGRHGGTAGPDLSQIGKTKKPAEIVESVAWPQRHVKPEFTAHLIVTDDGRRRQGYIVRKTDQSIVLRDPTKSAQADETIRLDEIEMQKQIGTLMPSNLLATLNAEQQAHMFRFLFSLGRQDGLPIAEVERVLSHALAHMRGPVKFEYDRRPLHPEHWPNWQAHVNRDRIYDFYTKQAEHFRRQPQRPAVVTGFPGLDGGEQGHWGNQDEKTWASDAWNSTVLGSVHSGIFRGAGVTVPRGVCIRLGEKGEMSACFNPDTLTYDAVWTDGFVQFSSVRHGFMDGARMVGKAQPRPAGRRPSQPFVYRGFYRSGRRVVFSYRIGDKEYLDSAWVKDGRFQRTVAEAATHPLRPLLQKPVAQWPHKLITRIRHGQGSPYALDTIELPKKNPWNALFFFGGHGFAKDGSAYACTMQGDVWHITGLQYPSKQATWRRFAAGLHHAQGLVVAEDGIFVLGRDQITRLHDRDGDGEADFYECFSNAFQTSPAGHDFLCGLERAADGSFLFASGNQGIVRVTANGRQAKVVATGFRNPDGLGLHPDGTVTVPCSEGGWTPAAMICAFRSGSQGVPFFGYPGPQNGQPPSLPLVYIPRGIDNSAGGQTVVDSKRWGPLEGQMLHFSLGTGAHFLLLRDEVDGQLQGGLVPLVGEFHSGAHRGRFNPADGQLYVSGMQGWGCYTIDTGCFQRVRYTGARVQLPVAFRAFANGIRLRFSAPLDESVAGKPSSHFAQCWNYRYSSAYGSPEFSASHFGMRGHDVLEIARAHVLEDRRTLFLELPDLQPVNQLHLHVQVAPGVFRDLFLTVHKLNKPFQQLPGYRQVRKTIRPHPILTDLAMAARSVPNPHARRQKGGRKITLQTGTNLSYAQRTIEVEAGELIEFTLANPDVVPHNWALAKPGTLMRVGKLANALISDPDSAIRHFIPETTDILAYTSVVLPHDKKTIYFRAPQQPGRYPYLCTFPGHWLVMNGELLVSPRK